MLPDPPVGRTFPEEVGASSPSFVTIYNQSAQAEASGLLEVAGPGYRKALEFLVKDYLTALEPEEDAKNAIAKSTLHACIEKIEDKRVKAAAGAAKLVGNDETHYVRKQEDQDINDLKRFIDITIHWLQLELETRALLENGS